MLDIVVYYKGNESGAVRDMGIKGETQKRYPGHFKQTAVEDVINNGLGYREAGRKYQVQGTLIAIWEQKYLKDGADALYGENRGKSSHQSGFARTFHHSDNAKLRRSQKQLADIENAPLGEGERSELNYLRMENALLKKLQALAQK